MIGIQKFDRNAHLPETAEIMERVQQVLPPMCQPVTQTINIIYAPPPPPPDEWWDAKQAAEYLKFTPKSVRNGAAKGLLPGHKYPPHSRRGCWRFKKAELDKALTKPARPKISIEEPSIWK